MKNTIKVPVIVGLVVIGVFASSLIASAQSMPSVFLPDNTISVHGTGFVEAMPDTAIITLDLEGKAQSAKASLELSNKKVSAVLKALREQGVKDTDMNVTNIYMYSDPYYGDGKGGYMSSVASGYTATQTLTATAKSEDQVATVIDAIISAGGTRIDSVDMTLKTVSFGIDATGKDAKDAVSKLNTSVEKVKGSLANLGISKKDVVVAYYSMYPTYGEGTTSSTFSTTRSFTLKIRDLSKVDALIDVAVNAGADRIGSISYAVEKTKALQKAARAKAFADAKEKAVELAELSDARLGRVRSINYTFSPMQPYMGMMYDTVANQDDLGSPGMIRVSVELDVTFNTSSK